MIVTRLDGGSGPIEIAAEAPEGVVVEPATVKDGATVTELKVTTSAKRAAPVVLIAKTGGKLLGKSHPIVIDPSGEPAPPETTDEN